MLITFIKVKDVHIGPFGGHHLVVADGGVVLHLAATQHGFDKGLELWQCVDVKVGNFVAYAFVSEEPVRVVAFLENAV